MPVHAAGIRTGNDRAVVGAALLTRARKEFLGVNLN